MKKTTILAFTLASIALTATASWAASIDSQVQRATRKAIQKKHGSFIWQSKTNGAVASWVHDGWAISWSAQVLSPKKGPLFTPRTWTDQKGNTIVARIVGLPTTQAPSLLRFADSSGREFSFGFHNLTVADQTFIKAAYQSYLQAANERAEIQAAIKAKIYSDIASSAYARNLPAPQRKPKRDSIEDRLEDMEAAAAAARMRQHQMESRQHYMELERRFEQYR